MNYIDKHHELSKQRKNYFNFICLEQNLQEIPESLDNEIESVTIEMHRIEQMNLSEAKTKIKFKTLTFESKL